MSGRLAALFNNLASVMSRPGIDPRRWIVEARVQEVFYDSRNGYFAHLELLPFGEEIVGVFASQYAGARFGEWFPAEPDDVVVVAVTEGDPSARCYIIARCWNASDKPPTDGSDADSETATTDVLLRVKPGASYRVRVSGAGGVSVIAEGDGDVVIAADGAGKVKLGTGALQPAVLGNDLYAWMQTVENRLSQVGTVGSTLLAAFNAHTHVSAAPGVPTAVAVPQATPAFPTPPVAPEVRAIDTELK